MRAPGMEQEWVGADADASDESSSSRTSSDDDLGEHAD